MFATDQLAKKETRLKKSNASKQNGAGVCGVTIIHGLQISL
jgi:hypothetical protein